jgi:hypothetical protein
MPTEPLPTFHYDGGGFPLHGVSYRLEPLRDPGAAVEPTERYGWARAPYRVIVRAAHDPRPHILEHRAAFRFLRDLGRLITCAACGETVLISDPFAGQTICDTCGYRADDHLHLP